jgi:hypothetical protein
MRALARAEPTWNATATAGLTVYFETVRDPRFARLTLIEALAVSDAMARTYREYTEQFATLILDAFRLLEPELPISRREETTLGVALAGAVTSAAMHWMQSGYGASVEEMVASCRKILTGTAHVVLDGVRR